MIEQLQTIIREGAQNIHDSYSRKLLKILFFSLTYILLTASSTLDYTRKVEPLPNMPKGNPDLSLGIVVHSNSTGVDVLADSSQNIRFSASKNYNKTAIELLRSSSIVDRTPKKFKFIDEKHGFSSDNIHEFSMMFDNENHQWKYIQFMPFNSVIEWVTEEKLRNYLNQWVKTFEDAGWKRVEYPKSDNPRHIQNFSLPTREYNVESQYCSWITKEYKAVIRVRLRHNYHYINYVPKAERKNIKETPDGYIAFIEIIKKSQYPYSFKKE
jgi:hypothetical protein